MTPGEFLERFPEFRSAGDLLIGLVLDEAAGEVSEETFGSQTQAAIGHLAAHKLVISPYGVSLRLDGNGKELPTNQYLAEFQRIRRMVVVRTFVT